MVTMSSTRRERWSAAKSENRAAGLHKDPTAAAWPLVVSGNEACSMYLSSADGGLGCAFLFVFGAPAAEAHNTITARAAAMADVFIAPNLPRSPDLFRRPARESLCRS